MNLAKTGRRGRRRRATVRRRCANGHRNSYRSAGGRWVCRDCRNIRHRRQLEAKRQTRLRTRRRRILERPRPHRRERIWAAGLFEGEGTVTIRSTGKVNGTMPEVSMVSTDEAIIEVFQTLWPGRIERYTPPSKNGLARQAIRWKRNALDLVEGFLLDIRPYLKTMRVREKAALVLTDIRERAEFRLTATRQARRLERMARMRALNRRGIAPGEKM